MFYFYICPGIIINYYMKLKITELAHQRGMTMSDIAKLMDISRVNLSNSLNGNPTLSRLQEVARILHVEVPDLFDREEQTCVSGYLEYNNKIVKIDSIESLRAVSMKIDTDREQITLRRETIERLVALKNAYEKVYNRIFGLDDFLIQLTASVEEGDVAVWEEYCNLMLN